MDDTSFKLVNNHLRAAYNLLGTG